MVHYKRTGFTIKELVAFFILLILFGIGLNLGIKLALGWRILWGALPLICGVITGVLFASAFVFLCIGIGCLQDKAKNKKGDRSNGAVR